MRKGTVLEIMLVAAFAAASNVLAQPAPQAPPPPGPALAGRPDPRGPISAPQPPGVRVLDETLESKALGRSLKYRVMLPAGYGTSAHRYPVLYLLHGLAGHYTDWEQQSRLSTYLAGYDLVVVMPEGENAWYTDSATVPADKFETAIGVDLVADVERKFQVLGTRFGRAIAGLSMGGYGALKYGLKYPGRFVMVGSLSGALLADDSPEGIPPESEFGRLVHQSRVAAFGPLGSPGRAANDVTAMAAKANPATMPYVYVACGTEDGLIPVNRAFVAALHKQKIAYEYRESAGAHTFAYWDRAIRPFLEALADRMPIRRPPRDVQP